MEVQANFSRSSALQSMLKNTIETGNIGQFSVKPSQLPLPTKRTVPLSTGAVHRLPSRITFARENTENGADIHQSPNYPYPDSTGSSSKVSLHQTRGKRSDQASPQGSPNQNERSYSMSQSSVINHPVTSPQLLTTTRVQQQGSLRGLRPRSPFAYPTRLKRPGYRPSSPALSERQIQGTNVGVCRLADSRADSPGCTYTSRRAPSIWQQGFSGSDPSFRQHPPSPAIRYNRASSSPLPQRMPTPGPLSSLDQNSSLSSRESLGPVSAKSGWNSQRSLSPSPVFYDYTEAFEDDHFPKPVLPESNGTLMKNMNNYHQLKGHSSRAGSCETSTLREVSKSPPVGNADVGALGPSSGVSQRVSSYIRQRDVAKSCQGLVHKTFSADEGDITPANLRHLRRKAKSLLVESPNSGEINKSLIASSSCSKIQQHPFAGLGIATSKPNASYASSSHFKSSSKSMYCVQSSSHREHPILGLQRKSSSKTEFDSGKQEDKPPSYFDQPSSALDLDEQALMQPALRAASFDYWSDSEPSRIYAPTPERSLSSPSHRDRFSRIFSIGEGLPDMDEVDVSNNRLSRCHIPERHLKERRTENSEVTNASLFSTEASQIGPQKVALAMRQAAVNRDMHEEVHVTDASKKELRKSKSMSQEERPPLKVSSEQVIVKSNPLKPSSPLRIRKKRRPALSFPVSPPQSNTEGIEGVNKMVRKSVPGKVSLIEEDKSMPHIMRHFPSLPSVPSVMSLSPPNHQSSASLSFSLKPLLATETNSAIFEDIVDKKAPKTRHVKLENGGCPEKSKLKARLSGLSTDSFSGSRPWNIDASYPWTDQPPELEVTMPNVPRDSPPIINKPRFRLKIHRASSAVAGATKHTVHPYSSDISANQRGNLSSQTGANSRTPRPSITINPNNSSHASQGATRYSGSLCSPFNTCSTVSPSINLVPPSPGLNLEVRSFFSDDSSQIPHRGSLRKRISQLKAIATRTNSTKDARGTDRGFLSSALGKSRASGRSSRQEATSSEQMYNLRRVKWRIAERVKEWFHRGEGKVRSWRGKMASKGFKDHSANTKGI